MVQFTTNSILKKKHNIVNEESDVVLIKSDNNGAGVKETIKKPTEQLATSSKQ